jgi:hypothetical protein
MTAEERVAALEKRVNALERALNSAERQDDGVLEINLTLPEADIGGLHFNEQKVHAVFETKEDGNFYSRDILFLSARDADEGTGRDLLSEYLDSWAVREAFRKALGYEARVFLPEENQGVKRYNGVTCWYWLRPRSSGSAANFCTVSHYGSAHANYASAAGGCAPAFRAL